MKQVQACVQDKIDIFEKICRNSSEAMQDQGEERDSLACYATMLVRRWQGAAMDGAILRHACLGVTRMLAQVVFV